ncbi:tyrosine-type recombinase/integrase [Vibrio astriarenae]|uniref:Tyrosine-type recombinase/integrase n=1 Tax=Vibrio astriarenae TaxID=1481923 RepID=A0A7Z2T449_9VIBR|nr:integrase domain-containing protein [Vibrio astriarenae]QIA64019.1 tyrosine-type recombinase/integrase [Vibrio astriarenae]
MARITKPLTNTEIKQAKAQEKQYTLSDGGGLFLRVRPNNSKNWLLSYYHPLTKKRLVIGFGMYPAVTLQEARVKRDDAKSLLAKGIDPKSHRDQALSQAIHSNNNSLASIADKWFLVKKTKVTDSYADDIWRSLELHVFPTLGAIPINEIEAPRVIEKLEPLAAKGSLETVKRVCQRLNEIMVFAVNTGVIHSNPLQGIKAAFASPKKTHMPTLAPNELPKLMKALSTASIKTTTRCLIHWQLHTMVRPNEAAGARWEEIDYDNNLWTLPAERMKKGKAHVVPLTNSTLELLQIMKPISGHLEFIFPADRSNDAHINSQTANAAIKRMGFAGVLVAHGLRSIASTTLNEQGFSPDIIEAALAHVDRNEVRRAYNRAKYIRERRNLMEWWSEYILEASNNNIL